VVGTARCFFVGQNDKDKNGGFLAPIFMLGIWWLMRLEKQNKQCAVLAWGSQKLPLPVGRQGSEVRKQPKYKGFLVLKNWIWVAWIISTSLNTSFYFP